MNRKRLINTCLGTCCLSIVASLLCVGVLPASAQVSTHTASSVTVVSVTIGKPTELGFKLSKLSNLPVGRITFDVRNAGFGVHNFKFCTTATATIAKNTCVGKATRNLKTGQSAKLSVMLTKAGQYEFLCSVPGHAAAGMKGLLGVGVKVATAGSASASKPSTPTSNGSPGNSGSSTTSTTTPINPGGGGGGGGASECPEGMTIVIAAGQNGGDRDEDDNGGGTDFDGCV